MPRSKEEIIEYLGIDKSNLQQKWCEPTIKLAMKIEKEFGRELENENIGYGLSCYFKYQREMLEDSEKYNLIKIKEISTKNSFEITIYRKEVK